MGELRAFKELKSWAERIICRVLSITAWLDNWPVICAGIPAETGLPAFKLELSEFSFWNNTLNFKYIIFCSIIIFHHISFVWLDQKRISGAGSMRARSGGASEWERFSHAWGLYPISALRNFPVERQIPSGAGYFLYRVILKGLFWPSAKMRKIVPFYWNITYVIK